MHNCYISMQYVRGSRRGRGMGSRGPDPPSPPHPCFLGKFNNRCLVLFLYIQRCLSYLLEHPSIKTAYVYAVDKSFHSWIIKYMCLQLLAVTRKSDILLGSNNFYNKSERCMKRKIMHEASLQNFIQWKIRCKLITSISGSVMQTCTQDRKSVV